MSNPAIRVEGLSKRYKIGAQKQGHRTFREAIVDALSSPLRRFHQADAEDTSAKTHWALKDVALEVQPGEVVGIVGRNGAGKSTLLKILARITEPTQGRVEIRGRVASLLEVGTGFHSELTGRENIYLNGAILGMSRREISRKFDAIAAFAEVERFIDTPVKRYSTGMYLRLAFAVAAHLEPDVLIVDEVLAVGDAEFQKKCLGRMGQVSREGHTVLFVSHQLAAVQSLCSRAIQLHRGVLVQDGPARSVISCYLSEGTNDRKPERVWRYPTERSEGSQLRLIAMRATDAAGELVDTFASSQPITVEIEFDLTFYHSALCVGFDLINQEGITVFRTSHNDGDEREWPRLKLGWNSLQCTIPPGILNRGSYSVAPRVHLHGMAWIVNSDPAIGFDVHLDHSRSPFWSVTTSHKHPGVIAPCLTWRAATRRNPPVEPGEPLGRACKAHP